MYPNLFGPIPVYFVMAVIGFAAAFGLAMLRRKTYGYRITDLVAMLCASIVGIIVGSKILFIITEIPALIDHNFSWEIINKRVINSGLVFYGGFIGALLCIYFLSKYMKLESTKALSFISPCFSAFHIFGRLGCLLEGCCYGVESNVGVPMPQFYTDGTVKYITRVPVPLYEAIALLLITAILLLVESDNIKKEKPSNLLPLYIAIYAPVRFVLEFWRGDILRGVFDVSFEYSTIDGRFDGSFSLSTSQIISIILIFALLIYLGYRRALAKYDRKMEAERAANETVTELSAEELPMAEAVEPMSGEDCDIPENKED